MQCHVKRVLLHCEALNLIAKFVFCWQEAARILTWNSQRKSVHLFDSSLFFNSIMMLMWLNVMKRKEKYSFIKCIYHIRYITKKHNYCSGLIVVKDAVLFPKDSTWQLLTIKSSLFLGTQLKHFVKSLGRYGRLLVIVLLFSVCAKSFSSRSTCARQLYITRMRKEGQRKRVWERKKDIKRRV